MSDMNPEVEWNIWIRPRRRVPSLLTRVLVRLSGLGREGIWDPWSTTHVVFSSAQLDDVTDALRFPHGREGGAHDDSVRLHLIESIGDRLRQDAGFYRRRDRREVDEDEMMPEFVIPLISSGRAARVLSRVLNAVPLGDTAVVLDPDIVLVFAFWRGSDLMFRDALMSADPRICDEDFRRGLIEDFEQYRADLSAR